MAGQVTARMTAPYGHFAGLARRAKRGTDLNMGSDGRGVDFGPVDVKEKPIAALGDILIELHRHAAVDHSEIQQTVAIEVNQGRAATAGH